MHKPNQQQDPAGDAANQAETVLTLQAITETMEHPEFTPEQLPALWQQAIEPGDMLAERVGAWKHGIETMYRRCETYPQYTKIAVILAGIPRGAWHDTGWDVAQAHNLLRRATPEQLQQALEHEQQHPEEQWSVSNHILTWANIEQLTGQVIKQLEWNSGITAWATTPEDGTTGHDRWRHISEHIQQQLLGGNKNAWTVFHGIVGPGTRIGAAAELANAIEQ